MEMGRRTGKEKASDTPTWAKGQQPRPGETAKNFAERLMNEKYGKGNWSGRGAWE
jgi:hypothetical protein